MCSWCMCNREYAIDVPAFSFCDSIREHALSNVPTSSGGLQNDNGLINIIYTGAYSYSMWKSHFQRVLVHVHIARKCGAKYHPFKCPTCTRRHHGMLPNAQHTHGNVPHNETLHVYPPFQSWLHQGDSPTPASRCTASAHVPKSMLNGCRSHEQEVMLLSLGQMPTQCTSCSVYDTWMLQDVHS
jgi:hypothetical protein